MIEDNNYPKLISAFSNTELFYPSSQSLFRMEQKSRTIYKLCCGKMGHSCQVLLPRFYKICNLSAIGGVACLCWMRKSELVDIDLPLGTETIN